MGSSYYYFCDGCKACEYKPITPFEPSDPGEETPEGWAWTEDGRLHCDECIEEQGMLDIEIELEEEEEEEEWPKIVKTYVHGSKEEGIDIGEEIGLKGEALASFKYLHYEVELTIKVWENGDYAIIKVDDFPVLLET